MARLLEERFVPAPICESHLSELTLSQDGSAANTQVVRMHLHRGEDTYEYEPFDEEDDDQEKSQLGEGTFGSTHRMRSKVDQQVYAVKMIKVKKAGVAVEALTDEAVAAAAAGRLNCEGLGRA